MSSTLIHMIIGEKIVVGESTFGFDQFKWHKLCSADVDFVIRYLNVDVGGIDSVNVCHSMITLPPMWIRQARAAQALSLDLPNDLKRHVFVFL